MRLNAKPQHMLFGAFNIKLLTYLVVSVQNCGSHIITAMSAGIVLRKV